METADEDDAAIFLQTQLIGTLGSLLDGAPLGGMNFTSIEEFVVASDGDLRLTLLILASKESSSVSR